MNGNTFGTCCVLIGVLASAVFLFCCAGDTEDVETRIRNSEGLSRVNTLCTSLPKPQGFVLVGKDIQGNSLIYDVAFLYKARADFQTVKAFYDRWSAENGWTFDPSRSYLEQEYYSFKQNSQSIFISRLVTEKTDYVIQCEEKK